jgi:hypothetical protein
LNEVHEDVCAAPGPRWNCWTIGSAAALDLSGGAWRLTLTDASRRVYSNAQIDDYAALSRAEFPWRPPVQLTVRARFSHSAHELRGTAGFGFWNRPTGLHKRHPPALPAAIWFFFASPPSNMALDAEVPGYGWKAATVEARWRRALPLLPWLAVSAPAMHLRSLRRRLWPVSQRAFRIREALLDVDMAAWHTYRLDWQVEGSRFDVDDRLIMAGAPGPHGPLGFVMWMDNQYAIVTPWGRVGYGLLSRSGEQRLEVSELDIKQGLR